MAVEVESSRRLFTADEFERMDAAGVFGPEERLELIHGDRSVVWIQSAARVALDSVPQPDLALLRPRSYRRGNPRMVNPDTIAPLVFPDVVIPLAEIFA